MVSHVVSHAPHHDSHDCLATVNNQQQTPPAIHLPMYSCVLSVCVRLSMSVLLFSSTSVGMHRDGRTCTCALAAVRMCTHAYEFLRRTGAEGDKGCDTSKGRFRQARSLTAARQSPWLRHLRHSTCTHNTCTHNTCMHVRAHTRARACPVSADFAQHVHARVKHHPLTHNRRTDTDTHTHTRTNTGTNRNRNRNRPRHRHRTPPRSHTHTSLIARR